MAKITPQKIHAIIRKKTGQLSSKYSPSQRIDRTTYDVHNRMKYMLGIMSSKYINEICEALDEAGIAYDDSGKGKGFVTLMRIQ